MIKKVVVIVISLLVITSLVYSQVNRRSAAGAKHRNLNCYITGNIYDTTRDMPIEYANIILFSQRDSLQITGTITDKKGNFQLTDIRPGVFYIEIRFMGYKMKIVDNIKVSSSKANVDLGVIPLEQTVLDMESVAVEAEKPALTYEIDRKIINVSQMQTAISGSAVDVLDNIPSVTVDIEGNISLRGSSNFIVLIDGRPTVLEPNDVLQQIPASTIENIEIITNPSAKYDPDGTSGIFNIIMKKSQRNGRSGLVNLNGGMNDKYGGDFLIENKNNKVSVTLGIDYNRRFFLGDDKKKNQTTQNDVTSFINSEGDSKRGRKSFGIRGSLAYNLSPKDVLSIEGRYGKRSSQRNSDQNYDEWSEAEPQHVYYISTNDRERSGDSYSVNMSYLHQFASKGHEILSQMHYSHRDGDEETTNELMNNDAIIISGRRSTEAGPSKRFRAKIDYSLPLGKENKFEAGYQSQFNRSEDITGLYDFEPDQNEYQFIPQYAYTTEYNRNTNSMYTIYSGKRNSFGYQGGFRGEYTYRVVDFLGDEKQFTIDRWDYFPTIHLSYQFNNEKQIMASYTRRIDRPRGYYLEPFETWTDAYNVRIGNPSLKPEYIDSYEIGYQTYFGKNLISTEIYYRVNHNKIDRIRSVYDANITLHSVENVGTDYAFGSEFLLNFDITKKWNINLMGNLYNYRIEGVLYGDSFSQQSFNWSTRLNNVVKIGHFTQIQINGRYNSPTVSSQGRREGFFTTDIAVKREFFDRTLSLTLQVRDILRQAKYEFTSEGPDFYTYNHFTRESPIVMLNVKYKINNYKPERKRDDMREEVGEDEEF